MQKKTSPVQKIQRQTTDAFTEPMDGSENERMLTTTAVYGVEPVTTRVIGDVTIRKFVST